MRINVLNTIVFLIALLCVTVTNAESELPHVFADGQPAKASEVNENFEALNDRQNQVETTANSNKARLDARDIEADLFGTVTVTAPDLIEETGRYRNTVTLVDQEAISHVRINPVSSFTTLDAEEMKESGDLIYFGGQSSSMNELYFNEGVKKFTFTLTWFNTSRTSDQTSLLVLRNSSGNYSTAKVTIPSFPPAPHLRSGKYTLNPKPTISRTSSSCYSTFADSLGYPDSSSIEYFDLSYFSYYPSPNFMTIKLEAAGGSEASRYLFDNYFAQNAERGLKYSDTELVVEETVDLGSVDGSSYQLDRTVRIDNFAIDNFRLTIDCSCLKDGTPVDSFSIASLGTLELD